MADREKDQWADALSAMSSADSAPPSPQPPTGYPQPPRPGAARPAPAPAPQPKIVAKPRVAPPAKHGVPFHQSIEYKRTLIPILLTCGVVLPALSLLPAIAPNSIMGGMPGWVIACAAVAGAVLLALAVLNMIQVKHQLEKSQSRPPSAAR